MANTVAALPPLASMDFDWRSADFSYLTNDTGQGFGTGSPLELHAADWDFSWLPDNLPPKVSPGVTFYIPNLPDIPTGGGVDATIDTSNGWRETFDHGPGLLARVWGEGVDFSVPGEVTKRWLGFPLQRFGSVKWLSCRLMGTSLPVWWRHAGRA